MTFAQHIRLLSLDDLLILAETVQKETTRRNAFIDCLAGIPLKGLRLTINTRDLLYRVINNRLKNPVARKQGDLTIKNLFVLLEKKDWIYIEYINARAFLEIRDALERHEAPLEEYYGTFGEKSNKQVSRRLKSAVDVDPYL